VDTITELDVLKDVTNRLSGNKIDYMLTGSFAMNYYAQPRMTRDIDIVVILESDDIKRVTEIFDEDYYVSDEAVEDAIKHQTIFNLIHFRNLVKVDIIVRKNNEYRKHEFERRQKVDIGNFEIWIVSKEDLILSKLYWAKESKSEMQIGDVRNLLATAVDKEYLLQWAGKLGVKELLRGCMNE